MRFLLSTVIVSCLAGGALFLLDRGIQATRAAPPGSIDEGSERLGLRRMLDAQERLDFTALVIGVASDDLRDFRGSLRGLGRSRPVYGQARRLCVKGLDAADCWEIAYLAVDGRQVLPAADRRAPEEPAPARSAETAPTDIERAEEPAIETADIPVPTIAAPAHPGPAAALALPAARAGPDAAGSPAATHSVARPVINTRSGPGTGNAVVTRLKAGVRLALLEASEGWGRFVVLGGAENGTEVWVALRVLEQVE